MCSGLLVRRLTNYTERGQMSEINNKRLRVWLKLRERGRPMMRNTYANALVGRPDLIPLLTEYEEAHDEVTLHGAKLLKGIFTPPTLH